MAYDAPCGGSGRYARPAVPMMRRVAVADATRALRCPGCRKFGHRLLLHMAYGLWCAVRRYSSATRLC
eukprot:1518599-Prymnesium_polylepis.1